MVQGDQVGRLLPKYVAQLSMSKAQFLPDARPVLAGRVAQVVLGVQVDPRVLKEFNAQFTI